MNLLACRFVLAVGKGTPPGVKKIEVEAITHMASKSLGNL
jgi:hypothetical protein